MKVILKCINNLEGVANWVVRIIGSLIFSILFYYAFLYTHYMIPLGLEKTDVIKDSIWRNLLCVAIFCALLFILKLADAKFSENVIKKLSVAGIILCMIWIALAGFWWINAATMLPRGDQAFLYGGASYFMEGNFVFLDAPGGYFYLYPHHLPLVALMEGFFQIVGPLNYHAYETLCVIFTVGVVLFGWLIVREKSKSLTVSVVYTILMAACFPLFFYTRWVYGEIPCLFFSFLAVWLLMKYTKNANKWWLVGVVCSLTMAVVTRKNALIMIVAFCIISIIYAIQQKKLDILTAAIATVVCPLLIYQGVYAMYEVRSGYEHSSGMPASLHIELGLHESSGRYGWYDNSSLEIVADVDGDWEKADEIAKERIRTDLELFKSDLAYTSMFFREKILSQWNDPLYQSLFFSASYDEGEVPPENTLVYKISHDYYMDIVTFGNYIQILIFGGTILYFIFAASTKSNILEHIFAVTLIGGFLFSIMWEAKGRYIFPYYVSMIPLAVIGYMNLMNRIHKKKDSCS